MTLIHGNFGRVMLLKLQASFGKENIEVGMRMIRRSERA